VGADVIAAPGVGMPRVIDAGHDMRGVIGAPPHLLQCLPHPGEDRLVVVRARVEREDLPHRGPAEVDEDRAQDARPARVRDDHPGARRPGLLQQRVVRVRLDEHHPAPAPGRFGHEPAQQGDGHLVQAGHHRELPDEARLQAVELGAPQHDRGRRHPRERRGEADHPRELHRQRWWPGADGAAEAPLHLAGEQREHPALRGDDRCLATRAGQERGLGEDHANDHHAQQRHQGDGQARVPPGPPVERQRARPQHRQDGQGPSRSGPEGMPPRGRAAQPGRVVRGGHGRPRQRRDEQHRPGGREHPCQPGSAARAAGS
jgi:hypothetical protein